MPKRRGFQYYLRIVAIAAFVVVSAWAGYKIYTMGIDGFVAWMVEAFAKVFSGLWNGLKHVIGL